MPLTDIVAKLNLANKENKVEARDGLTPDRDDVAATDAPLKPVKASADSTKAVAVAKSKAMDAEEPLLKENPRRFVILPIQ